MTSEEPGIGRQATARRGWMPLGSAWSSESGYDAPVSVPVPSDASTGATAVKPGATSRLTSRPNRSVIGDSYSHRTPALSVNDGLMRQSSVMYPAYELLRKYLSALPNA